MTLKTLLDAISEFDEISVQDSTGVLYFGEKIDFTPTTNGDLFDKEVDCIRADNNRIVILL